MSATQTSDHYRISLFMAIYSDDGRSVIVSRRLPYDKYPYDGLIETPLVHDAVPEDELRRVFQKTTGTMTDALQFVDFTISHGNVLTLRYVARLPSETVIDSKYPDEEWIGWMAKAEFTANSARYGNSGFVLDHWPLDR